MTHLIVPPTFADRRAKWQRTQQIGLDVLDMLEHGVSVVVDNEIDATVLDFELNPHLGPNVTIRDDLGSIMQVHASRLGIVTEVRPTHPSRIHPGMLDLLNRPTRITR